MQTNDLPLM